MLQLMVHMQKVLYGLQQSILILGVHTVDAADSALTHCMISMRYCIISMECRDSFSKSKLWIYSHLTDLMQAALKDELFAVCRCHKQGTQKKPPKKSLLSNRILGS